jgi:hypothetical protein
MIDQRLEEEKKNEMLQAQVNFVEIPKNVNVIRETIKVDKKKPNHIEFMLKTSNVNRKEITVKVEPIKNEIIPLF